MMISFTLSLACDEPIAFCTVSEEKQCRYLHLTRKTIGSLIMYYTGLDSARIHFKASRDHCNHHFRKATYTDPTDLSGGIPDFFHGIKGKGICWSAQLQYRIPISRMQTNAEK